MENIQTGYIKIFRSLKSHWIWADPKKLQWWLDILLSVNYSKQTVLIRGELIECNRGQSVKSLDTWAKEWLTTKKTVQNFFKLLQKDKMILVENLKVSTRITVCKYDSYNGMVNGHDTNVETVATTDSKRSLPPNNKDNTSNKENKENENNEQFSKFWDLYDKKQDREKCYKIFSKLAKTEIEKIFEKLPLYVSSTPDKQYRKNPQTWLNGKCWNDEGYNTPTEAEKQKPVTIQKEMVW